MPNARTAAFTPLHRPPTQRVHPFEEPSNFARRSGMNAARLRLSPPPLVPPAAAGTLVGLSQSGQWSNPQTRQRTLMTLPRPKPNARTAAFTPLHRPPTQRVHPFEGPSNFARRSGMNAARLRLSPPPLVPPATAGTLHPCRPPAIPLAPKPYARHRQTHP